MTSAVAKRAPLRWAVTGTPISSSFSDLRAVADWLGHWGSADKSSLGLSSATSEVVSYSYTSATKQANFNRLVEKAKHLMIRHTKSMQIGGEDALDPCSTPEPPNR